MSTAPDVAVRGDVIVLLRHGSTSPLTFRTRILHKEKAMSTSSIPSLHRALDALETRKLPGDWTPARDTDRPADAATMPPGRKEQLRSAIEAQLRAKEKKR